MKKKATILTLAMVFYFPMAYSQSWSLTGNGSTNPPTNFLGTTDTQPLVFKVNNSFSGLIDYDGSKASVALGYLSLSSNSTGAYNSGFGFRTLSANTTGGGNTASGVDALTSNTTAWNNSAYGGYSLANNTTGNSNTGIGAASLYTNTTGFYNVAMGVSCLYSNTSGGANTATGYEALYANTTGEGNTASGAYSLRFNTTGTINTGVGIYALNHNTTGGSNSAVGYGACGDNTTGSQNSAVGSGALQGNTTGYGNTAIGYTAMSGNTTGYYNTAIGYQAEVNNTNYTNATALGYNATATASYQVRIGNSSVTSIGGYVAWSNLSDGRVKKNIQENVPGLIFITKLNPVTYTIDMGAIDNIIQADKTKGKSKESNKREYSKEELDARSKKEQIVYTGFVAQEVESVSNAVGYKFSGIDVPKNENDLYGLRYSDFVVPLVKAVQELSAENDKKSAAIEELNRKVDQLQSQVDLIMKNRANDPAQSTFPSKEAYLEQNSPNPFNISSRIRYHLPVGTTNASLLLTNTNGQVIKAITLNAQSNGMVDIAAKELMPGVYFYSLFLNGKAIDTKQMVITK
ncbi:MAG: tail fiber domain-containing protein [Ferruginibacter sp.]|nr:tail fiber domain-containing protein [Ferruginibacter sp.]MBN8699105.1 tail fiber domain-containing protein [Chitinophagales bacterium]HNO71673.1 tail fiber domain-containing protein [Bacteroidia bacterium]